MTMTFRVKYFIKKTLAKVGLFNPSFGVKISPEDKARAILEYKTSELNTFVETGTEFGNMINMVGGHFDKVYSVELDKDLYRKALQLFSGRENIKLFQGDSAEKINNILAELNEPALFWLDAHGSGSMTIKNPIHCPVERELQAIFNHHIKEHVILIDDARHFSLYSISVIKKISKNNGQQLETRDGLFRIYRK